MAVLLLILKIIGIILLILAALVLVILFVPIRYSLAGSVDETHSETLDIKKIQENLQLYVRIRWMAGIVNGRLNYPEDPVFRLNVLFIRILPVDRKKEKEKEKKKETEKQENNEEPLTDKITRIIGDLSYYIRVLRSPSAERSWNALKEMLGRVLPVLLPRKWQLSGRVGTGDPYKTGQLAQAEGLLYPFIAGHAYIEPVFDECTVQAQGYAEGKIRIFTIVCAFLRLWFSRDVRRFIYLIKHSPSNRGKTAGQKKDTAEKPHKGV